MLTIEQLENLVRAGELGKVAFELRQNAKSFPRADFVRLANIANRVGQTQVSLRLLHPIVRSDSPALIQPTDAEKLEYANALRLTGLFREAIALFSEIDHSAMPIVNLRTASCLMNQWKYEQAIPFLRLFTAKLDPKDYSHVVAQVNLAACLVSLEMDGEALPLLEHIVQITKRDGHQLLCANSLELKAQVLIRAGKFKKCHEALDEAEKLFSCKGRYALYLQKWRAIAHSLKANEVQKDLLLCRQDALQQGEWETLRDCDLYIGALKKDKALLEHVYVGTPFAPFRKRIMNLTGEEFSPPHEHYVWKSESSAEFPGKILDVAGGRVLDTDHALDRGRLLHRLLIHLAADFYRPISLGSAFAEIFPSEHYAQEGRAERIHQGIRRLRSWFKTENLPLTIDVTGKLYRLSPAAGAGLLVPCERPELTIEAVTWKQVSRVLPGRSFTKRDITANLGCSDATAKRLLKWALTSGVVLTSGAGNQRKYRVA